MSTIEATAARSETTPPALSYRPDIDGLRTVAVLLVALNHAGVSFLGGGFVGVDVFFVISGFLITGLLLKESGESARISIADFYARRVRRILPAAAVVILVTLLLTYPLAGNPAGNRVSTDAIWSMLFLANVHFASSGTDYFDRGASTSPLEHYWSLGVEEQFYVVWPVALLVIGLIWVGRARRTAVIATIAVAVVASLAWSIHATSASPETAYFSPFARAFELGLGAGLAAIAPRLRPLGAALSTAAVSIGLGAIVVAAVVLDGDSGIPGSAVLLPTLGAVLVLLGGIWHLGPASRLVGSTPMTYVGKRSYGFYLWHFPFLMLPAMWVTRPLAVHEQLALVLLAFAAACVSYALLEQPVRHSSWLRRHGSGATLAVGAVILVLVVGVAQLMRVTHAPPPERADPDYAFGGEEAGAGEVQLPATDAIEKAVAEAVSLTRAPAGVDPPVDSIAEQGSLSPAEATCDRDYSATTVDEVCMLGDPNGTETIALWGDSHASMWVPALSAAAKYAGVRLAVFAKYGCGPVLGVEPWHPTEDRPYDECEPFKESVVERLTQLDPSTVILTGSWRGWAYSDGGSRVAGGEFTADNEWIPDPAVDAVWQDGLGKALDAIEPTGAEVVVLGDASYPLIDTGECLPAHTDDIEACDFEPSVGIFSDHNEAEQQTAEAAGATYVPVTQWLCTEETCPVVVEDRVVYRDAYHITRQYSLWLSNAVGEAVGIL